MKALWNKIKEFLIRLLGGQKPPVTTHWNEKVFAFMMDNTKQKEGQIVFVGDSNTELFPIKQAYPIQSLINRGIAGDTSEGVLRRMYPSIYDLKPSKVVINIGGNDFALGKSVAHVLSNYGKILKQIKRQLPICKVVVWSVLPFNEKAIYHFPQLPKVIELKPKLKELAENLGCTFVDVFAAVAQNNKLNPLYTDDGVHPNQAGFAVVAKTLAPYVIK